MPQLTPAEAESSRSTGDYVGVQTARSLRACENLHASPPPAETTTVKASPKGVFREPATVLVPLPMGVLVHELELAQEGDCVECLSCAMGGTRACQVSEVELADKGRQGH